MNPLPLPLPPDAVPDLAAAALHARYRTCGLCSEQDTILSELAGRERILFDHLPPTVRRSPAQFTQGDAP
jgi:hypothetical protein